MRGFAALLLCISFWVHADVTYRPTQIEEFKKFMPLVTYTNQFVPGGSVAWANYSRLRRDFPGLAKFSNAEIDQWIVSNFSYLSAQQKQLEGLRNSEIPASSERKASFRQVPYQISEGKHNVHNQGRADIMQALGPNGENWGFVDRKGTGVSDQTLAKNFKILKDSGLEKLRNSSGSNGVMLLGQAIVEVAMMEAVQNYLAVLNPAIYRPFESIEYYFILKLPMNALLTNGQTAPLAIVGRQAHIGRVWAGDVLARGRLNTKQFDFFANTIDPETIKIKEPIFAEMMTKVSHVRDMDLYFARGRELVKNYEAGDHAVISKFIEEVSAPLTALRENRPVQSVAKQTLADSFRRVMTWVRESPERFHRFAEVAVWALNRNSLADFDLELVREATRKLLAYPKVNDPIEQQWVRRYGIFLIPSLPEEEQRQWMSQEISDPEAHRYLAQMVWLLPENIGGSYFAQLLNSAGQELVMSLANKLVQADVRDDSRFSSFKRYFELALRHPKTREQALRYKPQLTSLVSTCDQLLSR